MSNYIYHISYGSYEDSCQLLFESEVELTEDELMEKLVRATNKMLKGGEPQELLPNFALSCQNLPRLFSGGCGNIFTIADISRLTKTHKKLATIQLNFLWKLDWLHKKTVENEIGGRIIEIHHYYKEQTE